MKNRITKRLASAAILCVLLVAMAASALAASYSKVYGRTQTTVRVRESASTSAAIIDNIVKDACIYVTGSKTSGANTFIKVNYRNSNGETDTGWVCQSDSDETYVKILSNDQAKSQFGVASGNLPSKKVGTFTAAERKAAEGSGSSSSSSSSGADSADVKEAQRILKAMGIYSGEITGNIGNKTKTAIKEFQRRYNLTVDGIPGPKTMAKLRSVGSEYSSSGSGSSSSSSSSNSLKRGSSGEAVRDLQKNLKTLNYYWAEITGNFGAKTETAVKTFQQRNNLTADGVAGTKTLAAIEGAISRHGGSGSSYDDVTTLKEGDENKAVTSLQTDLKQLGYYTGSITGHFGSKTTAAVKDFQKDKGITADGIAGKKTLSAIEAAIKDAGGSTSTGSTLKLGSTGEKVRALQEDLTALGYYYGDVTGHFGSMTQTAVKKFQKAKGMVQDGVVGNSTLNAIIAALEKTGSSASSSGSSGSVAKGLRLGDSGSEVTELQEMLTELGFYYAQITGNFGEQTQRAVRKYQDARNLTVDGIAGTNTLSKLRSETGRTGSSSGSSSSAGTSVADSKSYGKMNRDEVPLRASHTTQSAALTYLDENEPVRITREHNIAGEKWYYITVRSSSGGTRKGYVRAVRVTHITKAQYNSLGGNLSADDLINDTVIGMIRVTASSTSLRTEASSSSSKVATAQKGDIFYYVGKSKDGSWYQTTSGYWIKKADVKQLSESEIDDYFADGGTIDGTGTYKLNDTGAMVTWIQESLKTLKYYSASITGHYGSKTKEAVRKFQKDNGLSADGVAGPKTIAKIQEAISNDYAENAGQATYKDTIYNINWFGTTTRGNYKYNNKDIIRANNANGKIADLVTGREFKIKIQSAGNHLDVEPLTKDDTKVLCSLYGVSNAQQLVDKDLWQRRAVVFTNGQGYQFVGSIYAIPHGTNTIKNNDFDGQFCLHFLGSKTHGTGADGEEQNGHQDRIRQGVTYIKEKLGKNVSSTY